MEDLCGQAAAHLASPCLFFFHALFHGPLPFSDFCCAHGHVRTPFTLVHPTQHLPVPAPATDWQEAIPVCHAAPMTDLPSTDLAPCPVRRRVLDLIEVVQRGGLTAPWLSLPALLALTTDPAPDTAAKALRVLKGVSRGRKAGLGRCMMNG